MFSSVYSGTRILITGHTGFKGSWLSLWLQELGAEVAGVALPPATSPSHWEILNLQGIADYRLDIRNAADLFRAVTEVQPEIVFHLAAQPLVRPSYREPLETWSTNVMGTANLLDACRHSKSVKAIIIVTTDKVYENREWHWGYRETDLLGGHDPYSASKAASELVVASYRKAFFHFSGLPLLATVRAGNVIGGGDWSEDRLIADAVRAISSNHSLSVRSPYATRPWQHVLDCLSGYLLLGEFLLNGQGDCADAWNFGPDPDCNLSVAGILNSLKKYWPDFAWHSDQAMHPHESKLLYLDCAKAKQILGWRPVWTLEEAVSHTAGWYRAYLINGNVESRVQLSEYIASAKQAERQWSMA
jgi:CDP-glucose 4,6-dehydratase